MKKLKQKRRDTLEHGLKALTADQGNLYPMDLIIMGVLKRCESTSSGIERLVATGNMICAGAVLRMQLDTLLRFSAFWHVSEPQQMATAVLKGERINRIKDRDNKQMTDSYLVRRLGESFDWVPNVYEETSGYIHFSEKHVFASVVKAGRDRKLSMLAGDSDESVPEKRWLELLECATACLEILNQYIKNYQTAKDKLHS